MSSHEEPYPSKKKETRAGTRRVTSLTPEQLERKRANDREAQRTIRQRTKEHIERLELQVAELRAKGDKFDEVMRRNAILENEIRALRHQLTVAGGSPGYQPLEESYSQQPGPIMPSPQYPDALASRTPSVLSTSSQVSASREWPPFSSTRSSSRCESSDTEYPARVEPWAYEGPSHAPVPVPMPHSHVGYHAQPTPAGHVPESSFQNYPHIYNEPNATRAPGGELRSQNHNPQEAAYEHPRQAVSGPSEAPSTGYTTLQPPPQYQQLVTQPAQPPQPSRSEYDYDWVHRA
ncbi:hypothetical protein BJX68DRAFT_106455 [Aspergillus pseudodeflectus]|uniref:BZIP transcription factor n=1 Tax=Aspergillus pseudodeflectus TaxID=176178 RepID=A0ABR4K7F2_9EURO